MKRRNFLGYALLFLAGCSASQPLSNALGSREKLRFTVTDLSSVEELEQYYGEFRTALAGILNLPIEWYAVPNFMAAAVALQNDQVDFVLAGPSEYVTIHARTNAIPLVGVTRPNYYSLLSVRAGSEIERVEDLKDKTIAMWSIGSTSGHLGPTKLLIDGGLDPKTDVKIEMLRGEGLDALKEGRVDAWGGTFLRYQNHLQQRGWSEEDFRVLVRGALLPNDLFMLSSRFSEAEVQELRSQILAHQDSLLASLAEADDDKYVGAEFVEAKDEDYNMVREVYQAIGQGEFL
ncbi:PhnD/SsuA/transferrin family substrate-binding protein [Spirulina subsalsa]|uniref:PhnD/SsuA/transferrin family substrate-binding protein n=1 Tax=Spirulina subsalsa TaxID=54311 RepID=UPI0002F7006E|nr:PhnD/SsuA/transferrin family substrate-binding protein [Spirulina subsalsa]